MAKVDIRLPEEFQAKLSKLGKKTDEIAQKALQAHSRSTGELQASLGLTPVKVDRDGNSNIKVGFAEPRSDGDCNAKIANILEYGRHGQPARQFLKPAKKASANECKQRMIQTLEEEISKL